jgi:murein DD-endopeptidase MepM/ murein hydrolase activator NlpD
VSKSSASLAPLCLAALLAGCEREAVRTVVIPPMPMQETVPRTEAPQTAASAPEAAAAAPQAATPGEQAPPVAQTQAMGAAPASAEDGAALLAARPLIVPVAGIAPEALVDNYSQSRGSGKHEAIDILAPRGTPVYAVDDGKLVKLFRSVPGGLTIYHFDPSGNLAYYYAHLDSYAAGLKEGMQLRRGDLLGYVGTTGNSDPATPHLHFAVFRLGPEQQWWKGDPINPYPALRRAAPAGKS